MSENKTKPYMGSVGRVRYKIWERAQEDGDIRHTVEFTRSYQIFDEEQAKVVWKDTQSFSLQDLKVFPMILEEIKEYFDELRRK